VNALSLILPVLPGHSRCLGWMAQICCAAPSLLAQVPRRAPEFAPFTDRGVVPRHGRPGESELSQWWPHAHVFEPLPPSSEDLLGRITAERGVGHQERRGKGIEGGRHARWMFEGRHITARARSRATTAPPGTRRRVCVGCNIGTMQDDYILSMYHHGCSI
jgi:hypothetical protein